MNKIFTIAMVALVLVFTLGVTLAAPNGANSVSIVGTSETLGTDSPGNYTAIAGNVTELTISGNTVTQSWQGYYGNISGGIELSDAAGNPMYNWTLASPQGEIFASINDNVGWTGIQCFNWTANGTALETTYNINDSVDGINETFDVYGTNPHVAFSVATTTFNATTACRSADIFDENGVSTDGTFEEVLLADAAGNPIFAALLEQDINGFNSVTHDFQMLVLEDGHSGDTNEATYFFYVELE